MIGVGAPWILAAAALGALGTVVLHLLSVRRPPVLMLPTMRFLPDRPVRAVSRSARPSDLLLLLLRVAALMLIGIALAGVTWRGSGAQHGRVVVVQRSALENTESVRTIIGDAMRSAFAGDTATRLVVMDSVAHMLTLAETRAFKAETLSAAPSSRVANSAAGPTLSAAMLAGVRAAGALVQEHPTVDAIELIIAAPLTRSALDAATPETRAMWPGAIRLLNTQQSPVAESGFPLDSAKKPRGVVFAGEKPNDAVVSAFIARGWLSATSVDGSTAAPLISGVPVSVEWPALGVPTGWTTTLPDTIGAVVARGTALVFPFIRTARIPEALATHGRVIAWWSDGEAAAVEIPTATACTRHVGVSIPQSSDVLHGQGARALLLALSAPCGGEIDMSSLA
ncbi:MAG: BatA domain-containing protein, partial [Phycisphaerae bacterium]|nr:BatA domain-containing protein [Gemmatimonadaceae bacterium]